jgi:hypothetical protein
MREKNSSVPAKVDCDHEAECIVANHEARQSRAIMACAYYLSVNRSETIPAQRSHPRRLHARAANAAERRVFSARLRRKVVRIGA